MRWDHHKPIIGYVAPTYGFYRPDESSLPRPRTYLNKGYRNFAYILHSYISRTDQTLIDIGGASLTHRFWKAITDTGSTYERPFMIFPVLLNFGGLSDPHDVSRYQLYSPYAPLGAGGMLYLVEEPDRTIIRTYHRYASSAGFTIAEAGLYGNAWDRKFLLARAIVDPPISRDPLTIYEDGWDVIFPTGWTRWFVRMFATTFTGGDYSRFGDLFKDVNGSLQVFRQDAGEAFQGSPDVMIGRDNTPPAVEDYNLKDPIASLTNQIQVVEIDTNIQECRIVRYGTYTPATTETLGEVGLFAHTKNLEGIVVKYLIARAVFSPPVTLDADTTYTIGIALRLG